MAIVKAYAYEYFEPDEGKYILSGCYATLPTIEGRNIGIAGTDIKPWLTLMRDNIDIEESRLTDGFFQPNKLPIS